MTNETSPPICLVGNKCDVKNRTVSREEGQKMAQELNNSDWIEASAKENINVKEAFETVIRKIREQENSQKKQAKSAGCKCILM